MLYLLALELPLVAMMFTVRFVLRGAGDVRIPTIVSLALNWFLLLPLAWLVGPYMGGDARDIYLVQLGIQSLLTVIFAIRVLRGDWRASAERSRKLVEAMED